MKIHTYKSEKQAFSYIRTSDLPEAEKMELESFMYGQTRPLIEDLDIQDAVYYWDYINFQNYKKNNPYYFD